MTHQTTNPWVAGPLETSRLTQAVLGLAAADLPRVEFFHQLCSVLAGVVRAGTVELLVFDNQHWLRLHWSPADGFEATRLDLGSEAGVEALCSALSMVPEGWDHGVLTVRPATTSGDESLTMLSLKAGERIAGWLAFPSPDPSYLVRREAEAFLRVSETLAIALEHQRLLAEVRERVNELTCTYGLSRLADSDEKLDDLLAEAARLLPPALQFPEVESAPGSGSLFIVRLPRSKDVMAGEER